MIDYVFLLPVLTYFLQLLSIILVPPGGGGGRVNKPQKKLPFALFNSLKIVITLFSGVSLHEEQPRTERLEQTRTLSACVMRNNRRLYNELVLVVRFHVILPRVV